MEEAPDREPAEPAQPGVSEALLGLVGARVELAGIELREESIHLGQVIVRGVIAGVLVACALVSAGIWIAAALWDTHRLWALGGITLLYGGVGLALLKGVQSSFASRGTPFSQTATEFKADMKALRDMTGKSS